MGTKVKRSPLHVVLYVCEQSKLYMSFRGRSALILQFNIIIIIIIIIKKSLEETLPQLLFQVHFG